MKPSPWDAGSGRTSFETSLDYNIVRSCHHPRRHHNDIISVNKAKQMIVELSQEDASWSLL